MIHQVKTIQTDTAVLIMHCDSPTLLMHTLDLLYTRFDIDKHYRFLVSDESTLTEVNQQAAFMPLMGSKRCIIYDMDNLSISGITRVMTTAYDTCLKIFKTSRYSTYKQLQDLYGLKKLGRYCQQLYGGTLYLRDIEDLCEIYNITISEKLVKFLSKKYNRVPQAVCELFAQVKSGLELKTEKDIIAAIGLGDINTASWVLSVLQISAKSERGRKTKIRNLLKYLDNLSDNLEWGTIQNFIIDTLQGLIDIKTAIITSELSVLNSKPPDRLDDKRKARYTRLLRYRYFLQSEISLERLIYIADLYKKDKYKPKVAILRWLYQVFASTGLSGVLEPERKVVLNSFIPTEDNFSISQYDNFGEFSVLRNVSEFRKKSNAEESLSVAAFFAAVPTLDEAEDGLDVLETELATINAD